MGPCSWEGFLADGSIPSHPHLAVAVMYMILHFPCSKLSIADVWDHRGQDHAQILCACLSKHLPCPGPALVRAELGTDYCHLCLHQNLCQISPGLIHSNSPSASPGVSVRTPISLEMHSCVATFSPVSHQFYSKSWISHWHFPPATLPRFPSQLLPSNDTNE